MLKREASDLSTWTYFFLKSARKCSCMKAITIPEKIILCWIFKLSSGYSTTVRTTSYMFFSSCSRHRLYDSFLARFVASVDDDTRVCCALELLDEHVDQIASSALETGLLLIFQLKKTLPQNQLNDSSGSPFSFVPLLHRPSPFVTT